MNTGLDLAALLKDARIRAGLSQRALAEKGGTSQSVVARIELGITSPTTATLNRLLEAAGQALDVSLRPHGEPLGSNSDTLARRAQAFFQRESPPGVVSVYLFGSTARGTRHRESDVDIGVLLDWSVYPSVDARSELRVDLGSRLVTAIGVNEIDVVVLNDLPPGFGRSIVVGGRRLVCFHPELDHAFVRDVQLRWGDLEPFLRKMSAIKLEALSR